MITFDKVCFSYNTRPVLRDISFSIASGEKVAVLGGSGEGKTTILRLIVGLLKPDSGRVLIDGEDITGKTEGQLGPIRKKFSIVFQEGALFDSMDVKENVAFSLREYTKMSEQEIEERVKELLGTVGMEHALHLMPDELSGGMHRRVAIARALAACDPEMFLYDEPTSGLDPVSADNICRLILDLSKGGKGFIIVTHKMYDAMRVAERFMFMKEGGIVFDGDRDGLVHSAVPEIRVFLSELSLR
ncbi:MAG TPA: ATP-binding cassette domain-containing protein [Dissulfurispiraceae bacterium]